MAHWHCSEENEKNASYLCSVIALFIVCKKKLQLKYFLSSILSSKYRIKRKKTSTYHIPRRMLDLKEIVLLWQNLMSLTSTMFHKCPCSPLLLIQASLPLHNILEQCFLTSGMDAISDTWDCIWWYSKTTNTIQWYLA